MTSTPAVASTAPTDEDVPMPDVEQSKDEPMPDPTPEPIAGVNKGKDELGPDRPHADGDDDEVIAECDVYLNHMQDPDVFQGDLYMLQYPHRPAYRPYGDQGLLRHVDVEKKQKRLRMTYKLDQEATHYNKSARVQKKEHVLISTGCDNPNVSYCIAAMHEGKLTMTPLRSFLQCRAQLDDEEESENEDATKDIFGQEEIKMNFYKRKNAAASEEKPEWQTVTPFTVESKETYCAYEHFVAVKEEEVEFKPNNAENFFMERMCGTEMANDSLEGGASFLSKYVLSRMTLIQQVEAIIWENDGASLSYSDIRLRLAPQTKKNLAPEKLLEALEQCCICVNNVWLLQHEMLGFSDWAVKVRECLMLAIKKQSYMKLDTFFNLFGRLFPRTQGKEVLMDIIKTVGKIDKIGNGGAECIVFAKTTDDLEKMFPQTHERIEHYWKIKEEGVKKFLNVERAKSEPMSTESVNSMLTNRLQKRLLHEIRVLLSTSARTVADLQRPVQEKHPNNNISESLLKSTLGKATLQAANIRSVWFLQHVEGRLDPYRQCCIALFKENSSIALDELLEQTQKAGLENPTDLEIRQLLGEFAVPDGSRWRFRE